MKSVLRVLGGASGGAALGFLATILIARGFGAADFGLFASLVAIWALLAPLLAMGTGKLVLRAHAQGQPAQARWLLRTGVALALALVVVVGVGAAVVGPWVYDREAWIFVFAVAGLAGLVVQDPLHSVFQARERFGGLAAWHLLHPAGRMCAAAVALGLGLPFLGFMALYALAELLILALALWFILGFGQAPRTRHAGVPSGRVTGFIRDGAPFAFSGVLYTVYYQADVVMLGILAGLEPAGLYKAAFVFVAAAYLLPSVFFQKFLLPRIFQWWEETVAPRSAFRLCLAGAGAFGLTACVGFLLLADILIHLVYGPDYAPAAVALRALAVAVLCHVLAMAFGAFLVTPGGIKRKVRVQVVTAVLNIALNLALIPAYGMMGAVVATIASEALLAVGYALMLRREFRHHTENHADSVQRA